MFQEAFLTLQDKYRGRIQGVHTVPGFITILVAISMEQVGPKCSGVQQLFYDIQIL